MTKKENNFWNTCIRKLEFRPKMPCDRTDCEWYVSSKDSNNCFWTYIKNNSREDGFMKPLQPTEIGKLLNIPTSKILVYTEEAEDKLRTALSVEESDGDINSPADAVDAVIIPEEELEDQDAFDIITDENPLF